MVSLANLNGQSLVPDLGSGLARGLTAGLNLQQVQAQQQQREALAAQRKSQGGLAGAVLGRSVGGVEPAELSREQAMAQMAVQFPDRFESINKNLGLITTQQKTEAADFSFKLRSVPFEQRTQLINERAVDLEAQGRNASDTRSLVGLDETAQNEAFDVIQLSALSPEERMKVAKGGQSLKNATAATLGGREGFVGIGPTGKTRFEPLPEGVERAAKNAGVSEVQSSTILEDGTVQFVRKDGTVEVKSLPEAQSELIRKGKERGVDLQQRRAQARGVGAGTAKIADKAFDRTNKMRENNRVLQKVIDEVKAGAQTGPLISKLPSFRAESVRLDQLKNQLGLDVVGSVTFGALSEGELNLALNTALPTDLDGPELIEWAESKIAAQEKLAAYFEEQAIFLSNPGANAAGWLKSQRAKTKKDNTDVAQLTPEDIAKMTDKQLQALVK